MRYRPFGNSGMAASVVSLRLGAERAREAHRLVLAGLEAGINTFEIDGAAPALLAGASGALAAIDRRLVFVSWRLDVRGLTAEAVGARLVDMLEHGGFDHLDLLLLSGFEGRPGLEMLSGLKDLQSSRLVRMLGIAGDEDDVDDYIATGAFDALATSYNVSSGWKARNRLKSAAARDMAVIACDPYPAALAEAKAASPGRRAGLFRPRAHPLKGIGGYRFLEDTPGWTAEDICIAYAMTEPAVTTIQIDADNPARIHALADLPERDLPAGVAAQIEMARFSATA